MSYVMTAQICVRMRMAMDDAILKMIALPTNMEHSVDHEVRGLRASAVDLTMRLAHTLTRYWLAVDEQHGEIAPEQLPRTDAHWEEFHEGRAEGIMRPLLQMLDSEACAIVAITPEVLTDRDGEVHNSLGVLGRSIEENQGSIVRAIRSAADYYMKEILLERIKSGDFAVMDSETLERFLGRIEMTPESKGDA